MTRYPDSRSGRAVRPAPKTDQSPFKSEIERAFDQRTLTDLQAILRSTFLPLLQSRKAPLSLYNWPIPSSNLSKRTYVEAIASFFSNEEHFRFFYTSLSENNRKLLSYLTWYGPQTVHFIRFKLDIQNFTEITKQIGDYVHTKLAEAYNFYSASPSSTFGESGIGLQSIVSLPPSVTQQIREWLPKPEAYTLRAQSGLPAGLSCYEGEVANRMPGTLEHMLQFRDNVGFESGSTGKLLKQSVRKFRESTMLQELYPSATKGALSTLLSDVAVHFIRSWRPLQDVQTPLARQLIQSYMHDRTSGIDAALTAHIPNISWLNPKLSGQQLRAGLLTATSLLDAQQWYDLQDLAETLRVRDIPVYPYTVQDALMYFTPDYIAEEHRESSRPKGYSYQQNITPTLYDAYITLPILKAHFALMAVFGLVDLGYGEPKNPILRKEGKPYLTPFDGIRAVRLTELGEYALGFRKTYVPKSQVAALGLTRFVLDSEFLLITMAPHDPIKEEVLKRFATPISKTRYRVDFSSFMKGCSSLHEVEARIAQFAHQIADESEWAQNWREFFAQCRSRVRPIRTIPDFQVFKIQDDPQLKQLFATDPVLKQLVLRAENLHILVKTENVSRLKGRLSVLGYMMP